MSDQSKTRNKTDQPVTSRAAAQSPAEPQSPQDQPRTDDQQHMALRPPVDVFEDGQSIVLTADLPGVTSEGLKLEVDQDTLLIEAEANLNIPENTRALYAEVRNVRYRRSFALSSELDTESIAAELKHGVLTLRLPKRAEARPRRIEVKTG